MKAPTPSSAAVRSPLHCSRRSRALPSVETAAGSIQDLQENTNPATLLDKQGDMIGRQGESMGIGVDDDGRQFTPLKLKQGGWAHGAKEVVIDAGTARKYDFAVGDTIKIGGNGPAKAYTVQGIATFGSIDNLGGTSLAIFDVKTAQALFDKVGQFDSISVKAKDGASPDAVTKDIKPLLGKGQLVQTGDAQAKADAKDTNESLKFITYFLLGFGGIALFVGAFVILNTLSITVAQRSREFATLRTLGASRRQVMRSVVVEGLVVGIVASVLGLVLGLGIAQGMTALFSAMGVDLPKAGTVLATRTVIVAMLTGTLVTLVASVVPARRATRVPPISAVREGSSATTASGPERSATRGLIVTGLSLASIAVGLFAGVMLAVTLVLGVFGLFIGIAMLAPRLVKPFAAVAGFPSARFGGEAGRLARDNALRNPGRTASTAAALMIGLALVTVVATLGAGLQGSSKKAVREQVKADYVVTAAEGGGSFPGTSDQAIAGAGKTASAVRQDWEAGITGIDAATIDHFYNFELQERFAARARREGWRDRLQGLRRRARPEGRQHVQAGQAPAARGRHPRRSEARPAAGRRRRVPAHVRRRLPAPAERLHVRGRQLEGGPGRRDRRLPGREADDRRGVRRQPRRRTEDDHEDDLRPARLLGAREPVRDGQHAGAGRLRAHA